MQLQNKDALTGNSVDIHLPNVAQGNSETVDEFKYGFPSNGLLSISYRWWENKSSSIIDQQSETKGVKDSTQSPKEVVESNSQWTSSLSALRKKAVDDSQLALKLGIYKGYGMKHLDQAKKTVLVQVFKSSLPAEWGDLSCES